MPLFDAHAHPDPDAGPPDHPILPAAAVAGRALCGTEQGDWELVREAGARWPGTTVAYGLHPWFVHEATEGWFDQLASRLVAAPGAWLGEAGLDFHKKDIADEETQRLALARQLRLARELDRPANLHCVKAWDAMLDALDREFLADGPRDFVVHSYSGPYQFVDKLAARGAYFTQGALQARHNSKKDLERAKLIPEDRLLLESDAFLAPGHDDLFGLNLGLAWLSDARGVDADFLTGAILDNSRRLFG